MIFSLVKSDVVDYKILNLILLCRLSRRAASTQKNIKRSPFQMFASIQMFTEVIASGSFVKLLNIIFRADLINGQIKHRFFCATITFSKLHLLFLPWLR